jgi:hypothetical protein
MFRGNAAPRQNGEPGRDFDVFAVDSDRLAGGVRGAVAVEEQFQELDGLGETAAGGVRGAVGWPPR